MDKDLLIVQVDLLVVAQLDVLVVDLLKLNQCYVRSVRDTSVRDVDGVGTYEWCLRM